MTALIILGIIVAIILFLLFMPLNFDLVYDGDLFIKFKYLGITVFDDQKSEKKARKPQKQKTKSEKSTPSKKDNFFVKLYKQKGLLGAIGYCSDIAKIVLQNLPRIFKKIKFRKLKLDLTVATDDAANTAIRYGEFCAVLYPVLSLLQSIIDLKPHEINIKPDFDKTETEFKGAVIAKAPAIYFIIVLISISKEVNKLKYKESEKNERKQSKNRNGHDDGKASHNG